MLRRSSAHIATTLRSAQVTRLIPNHTANKGAASFKIIATNFNGIRAPMSRQFSSAAAKFNYYQRLNRFEDVWVFVTAGSVLLGATGGIACAAHDVSFGTFRHEPLFIKPIWFGFGAAFLGMGGAMGFGIYGAVCAVPIAFAAAFPVPAAGVATVAGVSLLAYKNRDLLFSPKPTLELASSKTETSQSRLRFE